MKGIWFGNTLFVIGDEKHLIVCKDILFDILKSRNIPYILLKEIVDMYTQNKILIKHNCILSELAKINKGVCQGCPLFNISRWNNNELAERRHKRNSTFKKSATVNSVICLWPSYNI
jgi:hypothetical protein